jgi:hypothetical protein
VPARLREIHPAVHAHDDLFPQDTDDEVWLREAARKGWIVLTRDDRIRYRPGEQQAIIEAGVACFCLNPTKSMTAEEWADALVTALPRILEVAASEGRTGYIKGVNRHGRVRHLFPANQRRRGRP